VFVYTLRGEPPSLHKNVFILIFNWHNCDEDYERVNVIISNEHIFWRSGGSRPLKLTQVKLF